MDSIVLGGQNLAHTHKEKMGGTLIYLKTYTSNNNCTLLLLWYGKVQLVVLQTIKDQYET